MLPLLAKAPRSAPTKTLSVPSRYSSAMLARRSLSRYHQANSAHQTDCQTDENDDRRERLELSTYPKTNHLLSKHFSISSIRQIIKLMTIAEYFSMLRPTRWQTSMVLKR